MPNKTILNSCTGNKNRRTCVPQCVYVPYVVVICILQDANLIYWFCLCTATFYSSTFSTSYVDFSSLVLNQKIKIVDYRCCCRFYCLFCIFNLLCILCAFCVNYIFPFGFFFSLHLWGATESDIHTQTHTHANGIICKG